MAIIAVPRPLRERLGEEGTDALVEVLNQLTQNSRADTLTFVEEKFERRLSEERVGRTEQHIAQEFDRLHQSLSAFEADLIKWMFILSIGNVAIMSGILYTMLKLMVT